MIPRQRTKLHPYRVVFWAAVIVAFAGGTLQQCPMTLTAGDPRAGGRATLVDARGDFAVIVSAASLAAGLADGPDSSWAWVDAVRQEVGPVSVLEAHAITPAALEPYRVVIAPRAVAGAELEPGTTEALEGFASGGGHLVLELPEGALRTRFGADGAGGWRQGTAITAAEGATSETLAGLRDVPLLGRYRGSTRPAEGARTLLAIDGAPVVYARAAGAGVVTVFDFEFGSFVQRLQQGLPRPDARVAPHTFGGRVVTADLVASPALLGTVAPAADALERYCVHGLLGTVAPVFAIWPFPDAKHGALLSSHESTMQIGRPLWMSIHERSLDARTTTFVSAPSSPPPPNAAFPDKDFVGHAAMLWDLDPSDAGLYHHFGLLGFSPVRRPLTLVGQLARLEDVLGEEADIRGVRVRGGRWTDDAFDGFRVLDAAELRYSATFGPAPGAPPGYVFGTCQPFTPIDASGNPFRLQEVPICFDNPQAEADVALLRQALETAQRDAWTVHLLTSADLFVDRPDLRGFDAWREALQTADSTGMWIGGAGEFVSYQGRRATAMARVSDASPVTTGGNAATVRGQDYTIEVETNGRGMALMLPARTGGLTFEQVTRAGAGQYEVAAQIQSTTTTYGGGEVRLVALNPGFTTLRVRYAR